MCGTRGQHQAIDIMIPTALGAIASKQAKPTKNTLKKIMQFLDYSATNPKAIIMYQDSNMILAAHSNASYLS